MSLREALEAGRFAVSAEAGPPKGTDLSHMIETARSIAERVDALNVTDNQAAVMRLSTLGACIHLKQAGIDPVFQATCRDRNRLALQGDLLSAASFGITDVLALTGDHVVVGDHPQAKPSFDVESVQLLQIIGKLNDGTDMQGNELEGTPDLYPGAVVTPEAEPLRPQLAKFEKKVQAGARFFQTQAVYDIERFASFMKYARQFDVKMLAGVVVLRSAGMARFMNANIPGIDVPKQLIDELAAADDAEEAGIQIAGRFIRDARDICDGVHVMAIGAEHLVPRVLDSAGLTREVAS